MALDRGDHIALSQLNVMWYPQVDRVRLSETKGTRRMSMPPPPPPPPPPGPPPHPPQGPPPAYGQPAYGQPAYGPPRTINNGLAITSMVLGLVGIFFFVLFALVSIAAIIFGIVARGQIKASNGAQRGEGMAIAGIVLGAIETVIFVIALATGNFFFTCC